MDRSDPGRATAGWRMRAAALAILLPLLAPVHALAQPRGGIERLQLHQQHVADLQGSLRTSISRTTSAIGDFRDGRVTDSLALIDAVFGGIARDTQAILASISKNSEFRDAVDDMRAQIDTLIARNMAEPVSATRDARLARLQELRSQYHQEYVSLDVLESNLLRMLRDNERARTDMILNAQVDQVAEIVAAMQLVVGQLTELYETLGQVAITVYENPTVSQ